MSGSSDWMSLPREATRFSSRDRDKFARTSETLVFCNFSYSNWYCIGRKHNYYYCMYRSVTINALYILMSNLLETEQ